MSPQAIVVDSREIGYFRIFAQPPGGPRQEITFFRGVPVEITSVATQDPFTDASAQLSFPQITAFDMPGSGDLDWFVPYCNIDIVWQNAADNDTEYDWRFEGFMISPTFSVGEGATSTTQEVKGALYLLDNYQSAPTFPNAPVPYEILMKDVFDQAKHPARLNPFFVEYPEGWNTKVPKASQTAYTQTLKPYGVVEGQLWTGLTTRSTGSWENSLSGFVQGLLSVMFTEDGAQWTIVKEKFRQPVLRLRKVPLASDPDILEVELGAPGVDVSVSRDHTQSANVIYGEGADDAGTSFSNMQVSNDGQSTFFKPFAWSPTVYPTKNNPNLNEFIVPKEAHIKFPSGMDQTAANIVARAQLQRFADPGFTGTITLKVDPVLASGVPFPRLLVKAGRSIRVRGLFGLEEGVIFHISATSMDYNNQTLSLTVDSKYRDQLTVQEVQNRTRDALTPLRSLQVGKFSNTVEDLILPWSYQGGSGIIPHGGSLSAKDFFLSRLPADATFPYEEYTRKYPPSKYPNFYIGLGPVVRGGTRAQGANLNWTGRNRNGLTRLGIPIYMGAKGTIRLIQFAAYDKNGNVMKVKFHLSLYTNNGISYSAMPKLSVAGTTTPGKRRLPVPGGDSYQAGQSHPFFEGAFESVRDDGTAYGDRDGTQLAGDAGLIVGWGNYYEPAGYAPGRFSRGAAPTGLLVDESSFSWDVTSSPNYDPYSVANSRKNTEDSGMIYAMIYCEDQGNQPVYFMGRMFRAEPGTNG